jgi:predicted DNA-binding protein (MmcQ/YjbR family)
VKNTPEDGEELREKYSDIIPGYHLNKKHWSSIFLNGTIPATVLKQMLDSYYYLVISSLAKKIQDKSHISNEKGKTKISCFPILPISFSSDCSEL